MTNLFQHKVLEVLKDGGILGKNSKETQTLNLGEKRESQSDHYTYFIPLEGCFSNES